MSDSVPSKSVPYYRFPEPADGRGRAPQAEGSVFHDVMLYCDYVLATDYERQAAEIERLRGALAQCNEHRDSPHKIIGIVDAALAGMPPYELAHESCGDEEPKVPGCHGYEP